MKRVGFTQQTGRRTFAGTVAAFMFVATGITIGGLLPAETAEALDVIEFVAVEGAFNNPLGEDGGTPPCVSYHINEDWTTDVGQAGQDSDPTNPPTHNAIRFGDPADGGCADHNEKSGFGFEGISTGGSYGNQFELGDFTHYNNPIEGGSDNDNVGTVDLDATFLFNDLVNGVVITRTETYSILLDETPNDPDDNPGNVCPYGDAAINANGCADRITITPPNPAPIVIGATSFSVDIGGFGTIDGGVCQLETQGNSLVTPEGGSTEVCVFGEASQATLVINKTTVGGDGTFDFEYTERTQLPPTPGGPLPGTTQSVQIATSGGSGTTGPITIEPGVYSLAEINVPTGVDAGDLTCVSSGGDGAAYANVGGTDYLDFDSDETITCSITNTLSAEITIVKDADPNGSKDFAFTTTGGNGLPGSFSLDDDTDPTLPNSRSFSVIPGDYTITETVDPNWQLTDLTCEVTDIGDDPATEDVQGALATLHLGIGDSATCTYSNTARSAELTVKKQWVNATEGEEVRITTTGAINNVDFTSTAVTPSETDTDTTTYTVYAGETLVFSEQFAAPTGDRYTTTLSCTGAADGNPNDGLTIGALDSDITCTYRNERKSMTFTLDKSWPAPAVAGVIVDLDAGVSGPGPLGATIDTTATAPNGATGTNSMTVFAGQTVAFSEGFQVAGAGDGHTTTLDCGAVGTMTLTPDPDERGGTLAVGNSPSDATCTFTNEVIRGAVTIDKVANPASISRTGEDYTVSYDLTVGNHSFIDETFDLSDTPGMASNVTITSIVVNGPGLGVDTPLPIAGGLIVDDGTVPALAGQVGGPPALVYTVEVTFTMTPSTSNQACVTDTAGNGAFNSATVTFDEVPGTASANDCVDLPEPDISVTKVADGATATQVGDTFQYEAEYDVTVTNNGEGPGAYTLTDLPGFPAGATVDSVTILPVPVADTVLEAGGTDDYVVTVLFTVPGDLDTAARECGTTPTSGQGGYNSVSVDWSGPELATDEDCVDIPDPDISVTKVRTTDEATHVADSTYRAMYTVTVTNEGDGPGVYSVSDLPDLGAGASVVPPVTVVPVPVDDTAIEGGGEDVYTVTVDFTVDGVMALDERVCSAQRDVAGQGAYNGVTVTWNDGETSTDEDCVDIPDPNVEYDKVVVGDGAVFNGADQWTVTYEVEVTNLDPAAGIAGPAEYDLVDTFGFGPDVSVDSVVVTPTVAGFTGVAPNNVLADDMTILRGDTHTYTIVVDVTITPGQVNNGDCTAQGGLHNDAGVHVATDAEPLADQSACASYSTLTLIKQLSDEDDGGNATIDDFTLTAQQGTTVIMTGTSVVAGSVTAGDFDLAETQLPGYESPGFTCGDATMVDQTVTVPVGANVVCTIINDDLPVDLELTKDDGGFAAVAGGDPIPYTITVQNIGDRAVDSGEAVTVVDTLPAGLSWNDYPSSCTPAGQMLTCDLDPALFGVGDTAVVIDTLVDVAPDAPSGVYENQAYVTTEDDPVCEGAECVPPPCEEAAGNNNVDCDTTPVDRVAAIDIIKVDDVADGDSVFAGDSYGYELLVTNLGPSTILPGAVVTDDLPGQLSLVSVDGGAGWTCNDADPIECTYAPELAPGEVAPMIAVEVAVELDATGDVIDNTAVVVGAVDRDCSGLLEAFEPACNEVTDSDDEQTPLFADADLVIVKTASVAQVGAGNTFSFELDVANNGPAAAQGVVVDDLVPSQVTVTGVSSSFFSCSRSGNDVSCTRASMAVGQSGTITITARVPADSQADTVVNIGTVGADTPDPNLDNNSDDAEVIIVAQIAPTTAPPPTVTLPPTGSNSTSPMLQLGVVFLLLGVAGVAITRRRHQTTEPAA